MTDESESSDDFGEIIDYKVGLHQLDCEDSLVAIKPSSSVIYSFFLLHATSDSVYELDTTSQYGHTYMYLAGTKVFRGHFFNYQKTKYRVEHFYKEDTKIETLVPQESVFHSTQ